MSKEQISTRGLNAGTMLDYFRECQLTQRVFVEHGWFPFETRVGLGCNNVVKKTRARAAKVNHPRLVNPGKW